MRLSAAMIVKNEEAMLPECLASIRNLVDEIVVVDTGSTDRTVEIAKEYGAKVFHHPWQNDFSLHRNQSIEYCTGDWVFIIDADERLRQGVKNKSQLKKAFESLPKQAEALAATVINMNRDGTQGSRFLSPRWIRPHLRYKHAKHNELQFKSEAVGTDFVLIHFGYDKEIVTGKDKVKRDHGMLREDFRRAGKLEGTKRAGELARLHQYFSNLFMMDKRWKFGIIHGIKALEQLEYLASENVDMGEATLQLFSKLYHTIAMAYYNLGDLEEAYRWANHGAERYPDHPDFHADLVFIGKAGGSDELISKHRKAYFESLELLEDKPWVLGCATVFMAGKQIQEQIRS